jgi:sugar transferase (PEP-CTERM/EpsH1 system associated)
MNILYVTTKSPLPTNDGHSLRTYNLLKAVAAKHSVSLLSFVKFPIEYTCKHELEKFCSSVSLLPLPENSSNFRLLTSAAANLFTSEPFVAYKYAASAMRSAIINQLSKGNIDLVHIDMLPLGGYLDIISQPTLLNAHNVESALLKRKAESLKNGPTQWYFANQAARLERFEQMVVSKVNHVVACSDEDRVILQSLVPGSSVSVVPNGVDTDFYSPGGISQIDTTRLVFIGGMNWFPNKDAVVWFDDKIQNKVLQLDPAVTLDVIGRKDGEMKLQHQDSITMHGFVDDVRPYLEHAAVVIVPIRVGGGTRLKVLEAMSMGKAMVSTSIGAEGIRVEHGKNVLIADTPEEFAQAVYTLLQDAELRDRLGKAARELVTAQYQWEVIGERLLDAYTTVLEAQQRVC